VSGETEASVSGWTVDTLREHIDQRTEDLRDGIRQRITDLDRALSRRMDDADKAIQAALVSAEKAVAKAETASEKRFEGVNEFRSQQQDLITTFMPRAEHEAEIKSLSDRVTANADRVAALELRLTSRLDRGEGSDAGAAGQRGEQRLNIGTLVGVSGTVLAFVAIAVTIIIATRH
jgi:hypothetical protein